MELSRRVVLALIALAPAAGVSTACSRAADATTERLAATVDGGHTEGTAAGTRGAAAPADDSVANSPLMRAIRGGHEEVVTRLLDQGSVAFMQDDQWSALMLASYLGNPVMVSALVAHGADGNAVNGRGMTSLMLAASRGHAAIVEALLAAHVNVNLVDAGGHTALMFAANNGHLDVVSLLMAHGADAARRNRGGATASTLAAGNGYPEIVTRLNAAPGVTSTPTALPVAVTSRTLQASSLTDPAQRALYHDAAATAWRYVEKYTQPDTGLVDATEGDPYTTVWDVGSLIGAVYAAHELSLIDTADYDRRIRLVLHTLGRLTLYDGTAFNKVYATKTGAMIGLDKHASATGYGWSALDLGRLLVWLKILAINQPQYEADAAAIVGRLKMDRLVKDGYLQGETLFASGVRRYREGRIGYEQYSARGFAAWGARPDRALAWLENGIPVTVMGHTLLADIRGGDRITSDPMILMGLELGWDRESETLARALLAVQQTRYEQTGRITMVGEDAMPEPPYYFYYYSALANGKDFALDVQDPHGAVEHPRWVSAKAAWAWHALLPGAYTELAIRDVAAARAPGGWASGVYETTGKSTGAMNINTESAILVAALVHARGAPVLRTTGTGAK